MSYLVKMRRMLTIIALPLLLLSCRHTGKEETRTVFRYNESAGIASLDPAFARDQANIWACNQIFNGLVQLDSQLHVQPCIASSWDISADGKSYTFHLRTDVRFQETDFFPLPTPRYVTANDVEYSFQRIADPATASPGAWIFQTVLTLPDGKKAFTALDDSTFQITLKESFPPFLGLLSPEQLLDALGRVFARKGEAVVQANAAAFRLGLEHTEKVSK